MTTAVLKYDWTLLEIEELYHLPFIDLLLKAQETYRSFFRPNSVQLSTLLNIKTGQCPEDCAYCTQSVHYDTGLENEKLFDKNRVLEAARRAKAMGATRFCMGAAWRKPRQSDLNKVCEMITEVKALGLQTCVTLGLLEAKDAQQLKETGLDFYNHNLDTSREYYPEIISTRTYDDRLSTLEHVRNAGLKVCCGGIIGMGESLTDRLELLKTLSHLSPHPESVPINLLTPMPGTPLENAAPPPLFDFIRLVAVARILMPKSHVRLSSGRAELSDEAQALCFMAGANSIHFGEKLLTTRNPSATEDIKLLKDLGLTAEPVEYSHESRLKPIPCNITNHTT
ncbi:MAG: biotin synthase BioB [Gammaproteobacteria bacterium]